MEITWDWPLVLSLWAALVVGLAYVRPGLSAVLGLVSQVAWAVFAVTSDQAGFLVSCVVFTGVYGWALWRWWCGWRLVGWWGRGLSRDALGRFVAASDGGVECRERAEAGLVQRPDSAQKRDESFGFDPL